MRVLLSLTFIFLLAQRPSESSAIDQQALGCAAIFSGVTATAGSMHFLGGWKKRLIMSRLVKSVSKQTIQKLRKKVLKWKWFTGLSLAGTTAAALTCTWSPEKAQAAIKDPIAAKKDKVFAALAENIGLDRALKVAKRLVEGGANADFQAAQIAAEGPTTITPSSSESELGIKAASDN